MISVKQLEERKTKVAEDIKQIEEAIETLDAQRVQLQANLYALQGASQQVDYFLSMNTKEDTKEEEEDE
jgi:septal ring factor EnvC (AmiA/AmiB activator)